MTLTAPADGTIVNALHAAFPTLAVVYLFGSAARGALTGRSDIDIAIDIGRPLTSLERWNAAQSLASAYSRDVDLIDFRVASTVLRHQILTTGRNVFAKDAAAQSSYEAAVLSEYLGRRRINRHRHRILVLGELLRRKYSQ
jgi:uncharacterized protein